MRLTADSATSLHNKIFVTTLICDLDLNMRYTRRTFISKMKFFGQGIWTLVVMISFGLSYWFLIGRSNCYTDRRAGLMLTNRDWAWSSWQVIRDTAAGTTEWSTDKLSSRRLVTGQRRSYHENWKIMGESWQGVKKADRLLVLLSH